MIAWRQASVLATCRLVNTYRRIVECAFHYKCVSNPESGNRATPLGVFIAAHSCTIGAEE